MSSTLPLNEHPRPDFHRGLEPGTDWLSLNGQWAFEFDPDNRGEAANWQSGGGPFSRQILVPFGWESHLAWGTESQAGNENWYSREGFLDPASVTNENYKEAARQTIGWYRRTFAVPESWTGRRIILHIGAVDYEYKVWVNGTLAGEGESGYTPVDLDITDLLAPGDNTLVVRAHDPQDHQYQPVGKQWAWYTRTGGIWQTVWLEPRPDTYIAGVRVCTDPDTGRVSFDCRVAGSGERPVRVKAVCGDQWAVQDVIDGQARLVLHIPDPQPWSPESPHLYDYSLQLTDAETVDTLDTVRSYFGLRSVSVAPLQGEGPQYIHLNGQPVYLRGALDQSFNPWGVYTFPDDDSIRRDIEIAKQSGFNFLRIHIKLEDPRFLYWADKLGILLMCDMPNYGYYAFSNIANAGWERTFRAAVERDFNHPSIFSWCLFNETWGFGFEDLKTSTEMQAWIWDMFALAQSLDPTRLIEDQSACNYDHIVTDINSWHFYINDYEKAKEHVAHVVAQTYPGSHFNYCPAFRQRDEPLMNSEYGGIDAGMGDKDVSWCFRFLTNELRKYRQICGYVYTELQDIEWEHNGFYDYDRRPKEFGYDPALLQGEFFVGFDGPPGTIVKPGEKIELRPFISAFGDRRPMSLLLEVWFTDSLGDTIGPIYADRFDEQTGYTRGEVVSLTPLYFQAPDQSGICEVSATLVDANDNTLAENFAIFEVRRGMLPATERPAPTVTILRKIAGDIELDTTWHEAEIERGRIGEVPWAEAKSSHADGGSASAGVAAGDVHYVGGVGHGTFVYRFDVPEDVNASALSSLTLMFEASSKRDGAPQTSEDKWPADITVAMNGITVAERTLADQPADARGALSHLHGLHGRYGELVRVDLEDGRVAQIVQANPGQITVTIAVPPDAAHARGLAIYSSRAGRYPVDVTLILR